MNMMAVALLGRVIACIVCVIGAYGLMQEGKDGWGWLLFLALCLGCFEFEQHKEK